MWACGNQFRGMLGEHLVASLASPTSNFAVGKQCQTSQVVLPPGMPQVGKQIIEAQLQTQV